MNGKEFKAVILFMANHWNRDMAIEIFGSVMGDHFYKKWVSAYGDIETKNYRGPDYATMVLFYEMSTDYLDQLVSYAISYYN